jgi:hypothetical protein
MSELSQSIQDDIRAAEPGWCSALVRCTLCGYEWAAVFPIECPVEQCECSKCNQQGSTMAIDPEERS